MEMPADADLRRFAFLRDGSEPGWIVAEHGESRVRMTVVFAPGKPTLAHLATLRGLVPELARRPLAGSWQTFRSMDAWPLGEGTWRGLRRLHRQCVEAGLQVRVDDLGRPRWLLHRASGRALDLEDDGLAGRIVREALRRGLPVVVVSE